MGIVVESARSVSKGISVAKDCAVEAAFSISEIGPETKPQARMKRASTANSKYLIRRDM